MRTAIRRLAASLAWLLHPLQAYDAAHDYDDEDTNA